MGQEPLVQHSPVVATTVSIADFRASITGRVMAPDDAEYDQARRLFYGGMDRRRAAIVRVVACSAARVRPGPGRQGRLRQLPGRRRRRWGCERPIRGRRGM